MPRDPKVTNVLTITCGLLYHVVLIFPAKNKDAVSGELTFVTSSKISPHRTRLFHYGTVVQNLSFRMYQAYYSSIMFTLNLSRLEFWLLAAIVVSVCVHETLVHSTSLSEDGAVEMALASGVRAFWTLDVLICLSLKLTWAVSRSTTTQV